MESILLGLSHPEQLEARNYLPAMTPDDAALALHFVNVCGEDERLPDAHELVESGDDSDKSGFEQAQNLLRFCDAFFPASYDDHRQWHGRLLAWLESVEAAARAGDRFAQYAYWNALRDFAVAYPDFLLRYPYDYSQRRDQAMFWLLSLAAEGHDASIWDAAAAFELGHMVPRDPAMAYFITYHALYNHGQSERLAHVLEGLRGTVSTEDQQAIEAQVERLSRDG